MKKWIALLLVSVLALMLVACDKEDPTKSSEPMEITSPRQENDDEQPGSSEMLTLETLLQYPASLESDFEVTDFGDGMVMLTGYSGDSDIIVLPETVNGLQITHIGRHLFANDSPIKAIVLSDSVKVIEQSAFGLNKSLEILVCGKGLEEIGIGAFQGCANLKTVVLNEGLVSLGGTCFSDCDKLMSVEVPASVTDIQVTAFYACSEKMVIIGEVGSAAESYASLMGITFQAK